MPYLCTRNPGITERKVQKTFWELSSVGSERLPYKQRVGGSNPSAPTQIINDLQTGRSFLFYLSVQINLIHLPQEYPRPFVVGLTWDYP